MSESLDYRPLFRQLERELGAVNGNITQVAEVVAQVGSQVEFVAQEQADTKAQLQQFYQEFLGFVAADLQQKERQFAATRTIEVRQELERRFGHYAQVRRTTTGILQATDVAIVREETMRAATENLMLSCPGYWLAPALVALTTWLQDHRELAERALAEALKRDDSKASLFFSLVCRRAQRMEACVQWLVRYFQNQNPQAMDREVVVMLDALANGVFGGAALTTCSAVIDQWLVELEQQAGFPAEQRQRWAAALEIMTPKVGAEEYPTLRQYSPTWSQLESALAAARRNQVVGTFFAQLFTGELVVSPTLAAAVDGLLDSLVTNFDDEELPLRREERLLQLIVEEQGDKAAAGRRLAAEADALQEQTNFSGMLTNAAMYPERSGATRATQRYAISRCRQWIIAAHQDLVARDRAQVPAEAELACGTWKGTSSDGANEEALSAELRRQYATRIEQAVAAVGISAATWVWAGLGVLLGVNILVMYPQYLIVGVLVLVGTGAYGYFQYYQIAKVRTQLRTDLEQERREALGILRAGLAELVDLRRELGREDGKATAVTQLLAALSSPQFVLKRPEQARAVIK